MFPFFQIGSIEVYMFWLFLSICFFVFIFMLKKTSEKFHFSYDFFSKDILWYFFSVFLFARLFYVISNWGSIAFINNPFELFLMSDYNFSLFGAIFGFMLVLYFKLKWQNKKLEEYIDGVFLAFIITASVWYVGALLGGQVYGTDTNLGIEISYNHSFTPVPYKVPIFPLPIVYALISFVIFSVFYTSHIFTEKKGLIGYLGFIVFACMILIWDTLSGKYDPLHSFIGVHFSQVFALILILICAHRLRLLIRQQSADANIQK